MPHIHKLIDFTVGALIVHKNKVLLIHHKKLKKWLPVGGHSELDEDIEEALFREIEEESGLKKNQIQIIGKRPDITQAGLRPLINPSFLDIHTISKTHRHLEFRYVIKAKTDKVCLAKREHKNIKWFTFNELNTKSYKILPAIKYYAKEALRLAK
ncbi:MAG: NUDIX domain-containing protein [Candidatus Sungbacteria bacterium]|nr:NUDIX domain-containing protein [Candidatus Sungbacteria bacterium]